MKNNFNMCPICGSKDIHYADGKKWLCSACGFDLYNNVAAAVGVVLADREGCVLFEKRAKMPQKGMLVVPGGFVDRCEGAEKAAVRECAEETGFTPESVTYLCSSPNIYEYKNFEYSTCDMFFCANLPENNLSMREFLKTLTAQQSEVQNFVIAKIETESDIDALPLAFESHRIALKFWLKKLSLR